jgi:hypothetical protein
MKRARFTIETDIQEDDDMEVLEKKLHYFVNGLYGVNTKVKWEGNSPLDKLARNTVTDARINSLEGQIKALALQFSESMEVHREAIRAHKYQIQQLQTALTAHTAIGNGLHEVKE